MNDHKRHRPERPWKKPAFAGFFVLLTLALTWQLRSFIWIQNLQEFASSGLFIDDAFYYVMLAKNFLIHHRYTFDGSMPTNGFQPLFQYLLTALAFLFPQKDPLLLLSWLSTGSYIGFSLLLTAFAWGHSKERKLLSSLLVVALVALNPAFQTFVLNGLEVPLMLFFFILTLFAFHAWEENKAATNSWVFGLSVGLLVLSRLDMAVYAAIFGFFLLMDRRAPRRNKWPFFLSSGALVLPYLAYNQLAFGSIVPISGRVKNYFVSGWYPSYLDFLRSEDVQGFFTAFYTAFFSHGPYISILALVASIAAMVRLALLAKERKLPPTMKKLFSASILHGIALIFLFRSARPFYQYYFAADVVVAVLLLFVYPAMKAKERPAEGQIRFLSTDALSALLATVFLFSAAARLDVPQERFGAATQKAAARLAEKVNTLPAGRFGAFWPGIFGYLCRRPVIPLDGIIGSPDFFEDILKKKTELDYLLGGEKKAYLAIFIPMDPTDFLALNEYKPKKWSFGGLERVIAFKKAGTIDLLSCENEFCLLRLTRR